MQLVIKNSIQLCLRTLVFSIVLRHSNYNNNTRKYMHAETLADKTIVFSERKVFKVVVMVTQ
jgi:hypothetical protein